MKSLVFVPAMLLALAGCTDPSPASTPVVTRPPSTVSPTPAPPAPPTVTVPKKTTTPSTRSYRYTPAPLPESPLRDACAKKYLSADMCQANGFEGGYVIPSYTPPPMPKIPTYPVPGLPDLPTYSAPELPEIPAYTPPPMPDYSVPEYTPPEYTSPEYTQPEMPTESVPELPEHSTPDTPGE